jgi:hypothetical protein
MINLALAAFNNFLALYNKPEKLEKRVTTPYLSQRTGPENSAPPNQRKRVEMNHEERIQAILEYCTRPHARSPGACLGGLNIGFYARDGHWVINPDGCHDSKLCITRSTFDQAVEVVKELMARIQANAMQPA